MDENPYDDLLRLLLLSADDGVGAITAEKLAI